nr:PREDICTED: uncharacterized protein LOC109034129 [Bemisia tabaci]XP_018902640.1 PREDICTED: uncharacterized protein LOC109034129 [Bemisia tabaci]XP_018902641.1 PREDICTED: uncharacterized protein LOC109034129 [Bemisia tabaci]
MKAINKDLDIERRDQAFNAFLCHICKSKASFCQSKVCSGCKLISYCGIDHQKFHWKSHKSFCLTAQKICRELKLDNVFALPFCSNSLTSDSLWCQKRWNLKTIFEQHLKRCLSLYEVNMLFFPRVCKVCYSTKILKDLTCLKCYSVSYCSGEHQIVDDHEKICSDFQKVLDCDLFMQNVDLLSLESYLIEPNTKFDAHDTKSFLTNHIHSRLDAGLESLVSQYYSGVLTVFHIISEMPNFTVGKRLIIHLVGASSSYECQFMKYWETLLHLLPELHSVLLIHIGPELEDSPSILRPCDTCWNANKSIQVRFHSEFYHQYCDSFHASIPNMIVSFNCGLHEDEGTDTDMWKQSLPYFLKHVNVPIMLTAYTKEEAKHDLNRLINESIEHNIRVKVIKEFEKNPYSCVRPIRDWESPGDSVFYSNHYVSALAVERDDKLLP